MQGVKAAVQVKCDCPCLERQKLIVMNDLPLEQVQVLSVMAKMEQWHQDPQDSSIQILA